MRKRLLYWIDVLRYKMRRAEVNRIIKLRGLEDDLITRGRLEWKRFGDILERPKKD